MKKYMFVALFYAFGLIAVPQSGYAKLAMLSDSELDSVTAQAGFSNALDNSSANLITGINLNGLSIDGNNINSQGDLNFLPVFSQLLSGNHDVVEFDIDLEKVIVGTDNISIGIGPVDGIESSLINCNISNLHVEMTGSVHVSVR